MKTAVYYNSNDIRIEERPIPKIKDGEILVKIKASGICGTDVMEWYRIKKAPRILGHEITGDIVESKSDKFKVGQRVFVSHHVPCNKCHYCLDGNHTACETLHKGNYDPGGFSEFVRVPKINVENGTFVLPENVSYEEGTMIEPLGCVVRAFKQIKLKKHHTILILGSGVSGLLSIQLAKLYGLKVIATDINNYRLKKAKEFGADYVINAKDFSVNKLKKIIAQRIVICTGAISAVKQAFEAIDRKGIILFFAIPSTDIQLPTVHFWRDELTLMSSYGAAPGDLKESLELIKNKINVKDMITHKLKLSEIQKGFKIVSEAKESLKVVIKPDN